MKSIRNEETRRLLLEQLRRAVCFQTSLWDKCLTIDETLHDGSDSLARIIEVTLEYSGKNLDESDLDAILGGLKETNSAVAVGRPRKIQSGDNLGKETRHMLLKAFKDAICMQREVWNAALALAKDVGCSLEYILDNIRGNAIFTDTGMELGDLDLSELLDEPEAEGYIRTGGPVGPEVVH
jgi:hypothetical protein